MDDCPTSFATRLQLPPDPEFISHCWTWAGGTITVDIIYSQVMDLTVVPAAASFRLIVDGNPVVLNTLDWLNPTTLRVTHGFLAAPAIGVNMELLVEDPNLRCANQHTVKPYGAFTVPPC